MGSKLTLKAEKLRTKTLRNSRPISKSENPDEPAKLKLEPKKKNKRKKLKTPKKQPEKQLKPKLRSPQLRAKPPLSSQIRTSTSEVTNRKPTAGTVRSVIFTLKCTETSCKKGNIKKQKKNNTTL